MILFVGRLCKNKGPDLLIQSMKKIIQTHKDTVLVIVGGKWFSDNRVNKYVKRLYRLARPIKEHVIFTKFIPADQIHNIFLMGIYLYVAHNGTNHWHVFIMKQWLLESQLLQQTVEEMQKL